MSCGSIGAGAGTKGCVKPNTNQMLTPGCRNRNRLQARPGRSLTANSFPWPTNTGPPSSSTSWRVRAVKRWQSNSAFRRAWRSAGSSKDDGSSRAGVWPGAGLRCHPCFSRPFCSVNPRHWWDRHWPRPQQRRRPSSFKARPRNPLPHLQHVRFSRVRTALPDLPQRSSSG